MAPGIRSVTSRINIKVLLQIVVALITIALSIYFIKHEGYELGKSFLLIRQSNLWWVLTGLIVTVAYLVIMGLEYRSCFMTLHAKVTLKSSILLALKRNFISVFLPAGGVSSLAFFTSAIEANPNNSAALINRGLYYFLQNDKLFVIIKKYFYPIISSPIAVCYQCPY